MFFLTPFPLETPSPWGAAIVSSRKQRETFFCVFLEPDKQDFPGALRFPGREGMCPGAVAGSGSRNLLVRLIASA
jgi:hypothetical protein